MRLVRLLPLLALLLTGACATKVEGLRVDPSFTEGALREQPLVMAVVDDAVNPLPLETSLAFAQELRIGFLNQRSWLTTLDAGALRAAMGEEAYDTLRATYRPGASVGKGDIDAIKAALPNAGYAVFARIEENTPRQWRERESLFEERLLNNGAKEKVYVGDKVRSRVERRMNVSLSIVDLATGGEVWGGRVFKSFSDERTYERRTTTTLGVVVDLLVTVSQNDEQRFPYPPLPDERRLIRSVFSGFGENLPGKEK